MRISGILLALHTLLCDGYLFYLRMRRDLIHDLVHDGLHDASQSPCSGLSQGTA